MKDLRIDCCQPKRELPEPVEEISASTMSEIRSRDSKLRLASDCQFEYTQEISEDFWQTGRWIDWMPSFDRIRTGCAYSTFEFIGAYWWITNLVFVGGALIYLYKTVGRSHGITEMPIVNIAHLNL